MKSKGINHKVLFVLAPLLILVGLLGFVIPPAIALTSGAAPYNIFHIIFGLFGLSLLLSKNLGYIRGFNIGFGLIDLYQALAGFLDLFPEKHFQWTRADDILHVVIGMALVAVGLFADRSRG